LKVLAKIISILFHPLFGFPYTFFMLLCLKPHWFSIRHFSEAGMLLILVVIYTCIIPMIAIGMMKFVGLIKSFELLEKTERILPLIVCLIFYLWMYINMKQDTSLPPAFLALLLSCIIAISLAFVINNWIKISLHALVMGAILAFWIKIRFGESTATDHYFRFTEDTISTFHLNHWLSIWLFLSGLVMSSRLILSAHNRTEIYLGFITGIVAILLGFSHWN